MQILFLLQEQIKLNTPWNRSTCDAIRRENTRIFYNIVKCVRFDVWDSEWEKAPCQPASHSHRTEKKSASSAFALVYGWKRSCCVRVNESPSQKQLLPLHPFAPVPPNAKVQSSFFCGQAMCWWRVCLAARAATPPTNDDFICVYANRGLCESLYARFIARGKLKRGGCCLAKLGTKGENRK